MKIIVYIFSVNSVLITRDEDYKKDTVGKRDNVMAAALIHFISVFAVDVRMFLHLSTSTKKDRKETITWGKSCFNLWLQKKLIK